MKLLIKRFLSLFPSPLPVGMTGLDAFISDIIELSGEYADRDSMAFALCSMIIHLGPQKSSMPKNHFVRSLRKVAANQVASQAFQDIKRRQDEAMKAAQIEAAKQEETALKQQMDEANKEV